MTHQQSYLSVLPRKDMIPNTDTLTLLCVPLLSFLSVSHSPQLNTIPLPFPPLTLSFINQKLIQ